MQDDPKKSPLDTETIVLLKEGGWRFTDQNEAILFLDQLIRKIKKMSKDEFEALEIKDLILRSDPPVANERTKQITAIDSPINKPVLKLDDLITELVSKFPKK